MLSLRKKIILTFLLLSTFFFFGSKIVIADDASQVSNISGCKESNILVKDCPAFLQKKVNELQGQANTLSSQIAVMDNQINLTEAKIAANERQILDLVLDIDTADKKIDNLQKSLEDLSVAFISGTREEYIVNRTTSLEDFLLSRDAQELLDNIARRKTIQDHYKKIILEKTAAQNDYRNQKNILEDKKAQIEALKKQQEAYNAQLDQQKQSKKVLLAQTQGNEATYSTLLSQAKAQLAAFQGFVTSQGGASLLGNQTVCDDWGCYYNQRDSQWGGNSLNGTGYTLADSGCLITSMAMVYTHHMHNQNVNPQSINSNSNNFASYYPAYLNKTITADGITSSRIGASIDSELAAGNPVIVGVSYDGGPIADHFVVLVSGSGGNYIMNDPFTPNGHNISFTSHYSVGSIREIDRVSF